MPPSADLSHSERQRYSRQLLLPEFARAQAQLKAANVLVVGAGGLGCPVISYLAGAGVGRLRIADSDTVSLSNLHRQTLYITADIGRPKAQAAAARAQLVNPFVALETAPALSAHNAPALLEGVTLVIDASDNAATRYLVHDCCTAAGLPWVWGAASGTAGMVSVFDDKFGLRDLFSQTQSEAQLDCASGVLGPLLGVVGSVMATEALKVISGQGEPLYLKLWVHDALSLHTRLIALKRPSGDATHL